MTYPGTAPAAPAFATPALQGTPWWIALLWLVSVALTLMLLVTSGVAVTTVAVFVAGPLYLVGVVLAGRMVRDEPRLARNMFTGAFLARYAAALFVVCAMAWAGVTELEGGRDYLSYDAQGWYLAENWRAGNMTFAVSDKDPGYFFIVGAVYAVVGRFPLGPTLLSAFFGGLTSVLVFLVGREMFDRRTAVVAGMLAAFLPTLLFWSSLLYKDTILAFSVTWGWLLALRLARARTRRNAAYLVLSFVPLFLMRPESAMTLGAAIVGLMVWGRARLGRLVWVGLAGAGVVGLLFVLQAMGMAGKISVLERFANPLTFVFEHREAWADQVAQERATGFSRALYGRNLLLTPHLLVLATALPFLSPIPGSARWGMNFYSFLMPGQMIFLALLPAMGYGALWTLRHRTSERMVLLAFVAASAVGVAVAGYFSNPRYIIQIVPLLLIFAALGVQNIRRWYLAYGMGVCAAVSVIALYGMAKLL
jgi:4-amino-4-deoxy-L-arabinose transferase-like glycosyltransferase